MEDIKNEIVESKDEKEQRPPFSFYTIFKRRPGFLKKEFSFRSLDKRLTIITSIIFRLLIIFVFGFISVFLFKEITDETYHIQEFQVPAHLAEMGITGNVVAHKLQVHVNTIIERAKFTWSQKEVDEYNQSSDKTQVQVEVAGIGFSPQSVIKAVKNVLGISNKEISGEIICYNNKLVLTLMISGQETIHPIEQSFQNSDEVAVLENVIDRGAQMVLEINDPLILGVYFTGRYNVREGMENDTLMHRDARSKMGIRLFRLAIAKKPTLAATAYAWWGRAILNQSGDTISALSKLNKSLSIDPNNALAYQYLASIKFMNNNFNEGERLMRKSLSLDPTSALTWSNLGNRYEGLDGEKDLEAIECFQKACELEPTNTYQMDLAELYYYNGKYEEAIELIEAKEYIEETLETHGTPLKYTILEAIGDSLHAKQELERLKQFIAKNRFINYSNLLNNWAFQLEVRKKYNEAFKLAKQSIEADSLNAYPYTTLAELCGLTGDDTGFYLNLEKAVQLGYNMNQIDEQEDEPYNKYAIQERYKILKSK